jgi:GrpB-like predicted nucleotidyltransferase (UPF0157 family)
MPSLRFENPELQSRFLHRLKRLSFEVQLNSATGTVARGIEHYGSTAVDGLVSSGARPFGALGGLARRLRG